MYPTVGGSTVVSTSPDAWPVSSPPSLSLSDIEGEEQICVFVVELSGSIVFVLLNRYSSLKKIQRILAYTLHLAHKPSNPFH